MKKTIALILLAIIIIMGAGALAAHQTRYINLNPVLSKIPLLSSFVIKPPEVPENLTISPIEEENNKLKKANKEFENNITTLEGEKTKLLEQIVELQTELTELRAYKTTKEAATINAQELASYYREIKPEAVVKIMDSLDDETILTILPLLEKEQTGKIMALMDSQRAALITQLLLDKKTGNNE